jgi:putative lipoprotein
MVIDREGQQPLAVPYVEEQLGDGRFNLSSEANNQRIELWVAPQRCVDSNTGSVQHMSAELRIDGQVQRGCGYFGGSRND